MPNADTTHFYETISDLSLGQTHSESSPHYESINEPEIYSQGKPADLLQYDWYHGNISREQADLAMKLSGSNNPFLVRNSGHTLILSKQILGWNSHDTIHCSPEGYHLEGKEEVFKSVPEMISHYQRYPIEGDQVLGGGITDIPGKYIPRKHH